MASSNCNHLATALYNRLYYLLKLGSWVMSSLGNNLSGE